MQPRIKLGELLVRAGVISEVKLKAALAEQKRWGGRLGKILVDMNFVSEDLMVKALSKQLAMPLARLDDLDVPPEVLAKIDEEFARGHSICPERFLPDKRTLVVAMSDPINIHAMDELSRRTGLRVEPAIGGERAIARAIGRLFGSEQPVMEAEVPPPTPVPPVAPSPSSPPGEVWAQRPSTNPNLSTFPSAAPTTGRISTFAPPAHPGLELAAALDEAQKKQLKAIRTLVEILIQKGVFSREEYLARITRR